MTPEQKLFKTFDLSEFTKSLFIHGLRKKFPDISEEKFKKILLNLLTNHVSPENMWKNL